MDSPVCPPPPAVPLRDAHWVSSLTTCPDKRSEAVQCRLRGSRIVVMPFVSWNGPHPLFLKLFISTLLLEMANWGNFFSHWNAPCGLGRAQGWAGDKGLGQSEHCLPWATVTSSGMGRGPSEKQSNCCGKFWKSGLHWSWIWEHVVLACCSCLTAQREEGQHDRDSEKQGESPGSSRTWNFCSHFSIHEPVSLLFV